MPIIKTKVTLELDIDTDSGEIVRFERSYFDDTRTASVPLGDILNKKHIARALLVALEGFDFKRVMPSPPSDG